MWVDGDIDWKLIESLLERSFYCSDPFGNKLCFVDDRTLFTADLL